MRSRLKMPVALPICSLVTVSVRHVADGDKEEAEREPCHHNGNEHGERTDAVLMLANQTEQRPKIKSPR